MFRRQLIANLPDALRQDFSGKWLFEEPHSVGQDPRLDDSVIRVSRHVQHARSRTNLTQLLDERLSAHAGHDHIGQQQINGAAVRLGNLEGFVPLAASRTR
jgi:hypothetical protein